MILFSSMQGPSSKSQTIKYFFSHIQEPIETKYNSGPDYIKENTTGNQVKKLEGGTNEPAMYQSYRSKSKSNQHKYEVGVLPDARQEDFRSGCCGKSPVTYESEEKQGFC